MHTNNPEQPAGELIELIAGAATLNDEQKEGYLADIAEGRMPADLLQDFDGFCAREQEAAEREVAALEEDLDVERTLAAQEAQELSTAVEPLLAAHTQEMQGIVSTYTQECTAIDRSLDQDIEGDVRVGEDAQADAIRNMLKGSNQNAA